MNLFLADVEKKIDEFDESKTENETLLKEVHDLQANERLLMTKFHESNEKFEIIIKNKGNYNYLYLFGSIFSVLSIKKYKYFQDKKIAQFETNVLELKHHNNDLETEVNVLKLKLVELETMKADLAGKGGYNYLNFLF